MLRPILPRDWNDWMRNHSNIQQETAEALPCKYPIQCPSMQSRHPGGSVGECLRTESISIGAAKMNRVASSKVWTHKREAKAVVLPWFQQD